MWCGWGKKILNAPQNAKKEFLMHNPLKICLMKICCDMNLAKRSEKLAREITQSSFFPFCKTWVSIYFNFAWNCCLQKRTIRIKIGAERWTLFVHKRVDRKGSYCLSESKSLKLMNRNQAQPFSLKFHFPIYINSWPIKFFIHSYWKSENVLEVTTEGLSESEINQKL